MKMQNPLSEDVLLNLIRVDSNLKVMTREGSTIEFKESYYHGNRNCYTKTMAAFANNRGGYIIFGIKDRPRELLGLDEKRLTQFEEMKIEEFTQSLNDYFSPEIEWDVATFRIAGLNVGLIYVFEIQNKPCICKKSFDASNKKYSIKEGDIYYRYRGRSERIHYPELIYLLNTQRENEAKAWMNHLEKILHAGPTNIATIDLNNMDLDITSGKGFVLDKSLAKELLATIKLIRQGEFTEIGGKPTLRLIGNLTLAEEIEVPDVDINIAYPFILKDVAKQLGIEPMTAKAMIWKYGLSGQKRFNLEIQASPKNKYPNQKYSQYAIDYLHDILANNSDPDYQSNMRREYANR